MKYLRLFRWFSVVEYPLPSMKTLTPHTDQYAGSIVDSIALISLNPGRLAEVDTSIYGPGKDKDYHPSEEMDAVKIRLTPLLRHRPLIPDCGRLVSPPPMMEVPRRSEPTGDKGTGRN